jgi:acyl carrier protein
MDQNSFITLFAEQFSSVSASELKPETRIRDINGWDSITAMLVINLADEHFQVTINGDDLRKCETVGQLHQLLQSRKQ